MSKYPTVLSEIDVEVHFSSEKEVRATYSDPGSPGFIEIDSVLVNGKIDIVGALTEKEIEALVEEIMESEDDQEAYFDDHAWNDGEMSEEAGR